MTREFERRSIQCVTPSGLHRLSYVEWGGRRDEAAHPRPVLVCVHGLTRCARDFDSLARALSDHYRVVCPDLPGRGESDWLRNAAEYGVPAYVSDMVTLIARLDVESVDWLGTSLGGIVGMAFAAMPANPIRRMVLNDVGPLLTAASLRRIGEYVGQAPSFDSIEAATDYVRSTSATFGPHTGGQWRSLTEHMVRRDAGGRWHMRYDPAIALTYNDRDPAKDVNIWPLYDAMRAPTLVLRGAESDLLTRETAQAMTQRGPRAKMVEVPGVGHAPTLMDDRQIRPVRDFLLS
jgi:pimeloyl-ACP methyl ester carboxylesterase